MALKWKMKMLFVGPVKFPWGCPKNKFFFGPFPFSPLAQKINSPLKRKKEKKKLGGGEKLNLGAPFPLPRGVSPGKVPGNLKFTRENPC